MKKRNALIITLVAVIALAAVPFLHAGPGGGHHRGGFGGGMHAFGILGHLNQLKEDLDLSDAQADQIRAIFKDLHEQNAPYRDQLHGGFQSVAAALLQDPNNLAAAQAVIDRQANAEKAMKANLLTATSKALNVLTAEQRAELATKLADHAERRERRQRR